MQWLKGLGFLVLAVSPGLVGAAEKKADSAARGEEVLKHKAMVPPLALRSGYDRLWKVWGLKEKPKDLLQGFNDRYGIQKAPYDNGDLPLGLVEGPPLFGRTVVHTCLLCHAGRIAGQTMIGLGNHALDFQTFYEDLSRLSFVKFPEPFPFATTRGTVEAIAAASYVVHLRDENLNMRKAPPRKYPQNTCEDIPAWWQLKKKKYMYHTGSHPVGAVRPLMTFMLTPATSAKQFKKAEPMFRDIRDYLLSIKAPKYPFKIDQAQVTTGKAVFEKTCARCHGTYGPNGKYPSKVVDVDIVGTDSTLVDSYDEKETEHYNAGWFGQERRPDGKLYKGQWVRGYQAPPLNGIWATAPYFHNGSVPTVYHVLNSKARPKIFTRSYRSEKEDYDPIKVGHRYKALKEGAKPSMSGWQRRKIYDTTKPGRGNQGHTFGDRLKEKERMALIEYLKTL